MTRIICSPEWENPLPEETDDEWDESYDPDRTGEGADADLVYDEDDYGYDPYGDESEDEEAYQ